MIQAEGLATATTEGKEVQLPTIGPSTVLQVRGQSCQQVPPTGCQQQVEPDASLPGCPLDWILDNTYNAPVLLPLGQRWHVHASACWIVLDEDSYRSGSARAANDVLAASEQRSNKIHSTAHGPPLYRALSIPTLLIPGFSQTATWL